ncbi:MAG: extracellular solute-binding protein [bacterium]
MRRISVFVCACAILMATAVGISHESFAQRKLRFWTSHYNPELIKWYEEKMFPEFEKENPGVKVELLTIPWGERDAKILTAFASGTVPEVIQTGSEMLYDEATRNMSVPLDDYVAKWEERDKFYPIAIQSRSLAGHIYSIPTHLAPRAVRWNKGIFKEVGLDPERPPDTWEYLKEAALKCNKREGRNLIRLGADLWWDNTFNQGLISFWLQNNVDVISEDFSKPLFNTQKGVDTLQYMVDMYNLLQPVGTAPLVAGVIPHFEAEKIAIQVAVPMNLRLIKMHAPNLDVGLTVPRGPKEGGRPVLLMCHNGNYIPVGSKDPDLSWKFISFFARERWMNEYNAHFYSINARKDGKDYPFVRESPWMKFWYKAIEEDLGVLFPQMPEWSKIQKILFDEAQAAYKKVKTPKQALEEAAKGWEEVLKTARKPPGM